MRKAGKKIGNSIYVHRSYEHRFPNVLKARDRINTDFFKYDVIKINNNNGNVSFIKCYGWYDLDEPIVGEILIVDKDGIVKSLRMGKDPWIYHHKWMMVDDDYEGFDVEKSKQRSKQWESLNPDKSRIGKLSYWEEYILPELGEA